MVLGKMGLGGKERYYATWLYRVRGVREGYYVPGRGKEGYYGT